MKLSPKDIVDIVHAFEIDLIPAEALAKRYGMSRQGIWKALKRTGIDTTTHKIPVTCSACGEVTYRPKSKIRNRKSVFCNQDCYTAYLDAGNGMGPYISNRHGQRIARVTISKYFDLQPGQIVHHEDRNCLNNMIYNLKVFANQGDHIRHHRLGPDYVKPVFDGPEI